MGRTDGVLIGQIRGAQIGRRSILLVQSGCIRPLTHAQVQVALAGVGRSTASTNKRTKILITHLQFSA